MNYNLVQELNFKQKVERSLGLLRDAYEGHQEGLVIANSLGKDSVVVWHLAKQVNQKIRGFIVTTIYKPKATKEFMQREVTKYPELQVFESKNPVTGLYRTDPDRCCQLLKVEPTHRAIEEMNVTCWVTGLRCTEGRTRVAFEEIEERDVGLIKLNPILLWTEREVWQYIALNKIDVNPLYGEGYRSLGCAPCSNIATSGEGERDGRWQDTSKCGGECGIHTKPLKG